MSKTSMFMKRMFNTQKGKVRTASSHQRVDLELRETLIKTGNLGGDMIQVLNLEGEEGWVHKDYLISTSIEFTTSTNETTPD